MYKYVESKGIKYRIDFCEVIDEGKTGYWVEDDWGCFEYHRTKAYYRPERTWDDHLGNTPCGYYVIAPLPTGERRRVYMF